MSPIGPAPPPIDTGMGHSGGAHLGPEQLVKLVTLHALEGDGAAAAGLVPEMVEVCTEQWGMDSDRTHAAYNIGMEVYASEGRYRDAADLCETLLDAQNDSPGPGDLETLRTANLLNVYRAKAAGGDPGSRLLHQSAHLGPHHPDVLELRLEKAVDGLNNGAHPSDSVLQFRAIFEDYLQHYGVDNPAVIVAGGYLLSALNQAGMVGEIPDLGRQLLTLQAAARARGGWGLQGRLDEMSRVVREQVADALIASGFPWDGAEHYKALIGETSEVLGGDDEEVLRLRRELVTVEAWESDDVESGAAAYRELLGDLERVVGRGHPETLRVRTEYGAYLFEHGQRVEGFGLLVQAVGDAEGAFGVNHPIPLAARRAHRVALLRTSAPYGEKLALHRENIADHIAVLGPEDRVTFRARNALLGFLTANIGDGDGPDGAVVYAQGLVADAGRVLGMLHVDTLEYRLEAATLAPLVGDFAGAKRQAEVLYADYVRVLGEESVATAAAAEFLRWLG